MHIHPMGQDHKPPMHLLNACQIRRRPIQWTTTMENVSLYTLWTEHCKYCSEIHTFDLSQSTFRKHSIVWKKKMKYIKVSHGLFISDSLVLNWLYPRVNFKKKEMHVLHKQLQLQTNYYLTQEGNYNSGTDIFMPVTLNGAV